MDSIFFFLVEQVEFVPTRKKRETNATTTTALRVTLAEIGSIFPKLFVFDSPGSHGMPGGNEYNG